MKLYTAPKFEPKSDGSLSINATLVADWLVKFLHEECVIQRKIERAVIGISGGVDSAVTAYLCARAFGPDRVLGVRMPYKLSSPESLAHGQLVVDALGIEERTVDITAMVDGYCCPSEPEITPLRLGNVCARCRMTVLYDQAAKTNALPIGTSNKTERLFGYFTWHGDDAPAVNPLGDLFKSQILQLARVLGVPDVIVNKPPTADLVKGQTDEGDWGITIAEADRILVHLVKGVDYQTLVRWGFPESQVSLVARKVASTHWKRHLPTVAMISDSAVNEFYLRPVDY